MRMDSNVIPLLLFMGENCAIEKAYMLCLTLQKLA